jgi:hypothetical protein
MELRVPARCVLAVEVPIVNPDSQSRHASSSSACVACVVVYALRWCELLLSAVCCRRLTLLLLLLLLLLRRGDGDDECVGRAPRALIT